MKKILLVVLLVGAGIAGFKYWDKEQGMRAARQRVEAIVRAMADSDQQKAIGLWAENREKLDAAGVEAAQLPFQTFWRESGLSSSSSWVVVNVEPAGSGTFNVTARSGDQTIVLRVPQRGRLSKV
jgi:hypothetical protein